MLTKEYITDLKINGNGLFGELVRDNSSNIGNLVFILENLGHLPINFDGKWLLDLTQSKFSQVRELAVKNIAKLTQTEYIETLNKIIKTDTDTNVRREAVSAIGRMRNINNNKLLVKILKDKDPKIVCQAIRGLLVFKNDEEVDNSLKSLINHENEMVRTVIYKEYFAKERIRENEKPHAETYEYLKNVIVNGDVREVLKNVPNESIHLTFTSPPYYNARDYSIYPSYKAYLNFLEEVFLETYRVTKEGRFLIVNTSPIIIPRVSRAHSSKRYPIPFDIHHYLMQMGWEFIDDIIWLKPEYSVKNRIGGFQQHRKPLAYKPNSITEYLMVYRKQTEKLLDWNIRQYDYKTVEESKVSEGYETTNVWKIDPKFDKIHSAVFPAELCKRVIEYYSFKNDLIFDPFAGSGTLGRTAKSLGRLFFLTEQEQKYFEYMKTFLKKESLFKEKPTSFLTLSEFKETIK
ncbi:MAG: DNA methyltransferase [Bacteroidales bacterium]|jgi:DNA modification methylase